MANLLHKVAILMISLVKSAHQLIMIAFYHLFENCYHNLKSISVLNVNEGHDYDDFSVWTLKFGNSWKTNYFA